MKKIVLLTITGLSLLTLAACGSSKMESDSNNSHSNLSDTKKDVDTSTYQVGKDMMKNERVYYYADYDENNPLGVNTKIECVYLFKKGKISVYAVTSQYSDSDAITLGSLKGLNQKEIINKIVSNNKKQFEKAKEETKKINPNVTAKGEYIEPNSQKIKIEALTDSSGNTVSKERISAENVNISGGSLESVPRIEGDTGEPAGGLDAGQKNKTISFTISNYEKGAFSVFNQNYSFFNLDSDEAFITTNNSSQLPELDSLDNSFVKVQTKDFDRID